jgi:hypothetical protein
MIRYFMSRRFSELDAAATALEGLGFVPGRRSASMKT